MMMVFRLTDNSFKCFCRLTHTKSNVSKNKGFSETISLPQTKLPLRLSNKALIERDTYLNSNSSYKNLYARQENRLTSQFVLHDGPPYANGNPHMGHAINKIMKDTILRHKISKGEKVHYVPGWDCHGLPIELKAISNNKGNMSPIEIRTKARNFAKETIDVQRKVFESWGVLGNWDKSYKTYSNSYIKNQMNVFYELYKKNLIFRDIKPVYWSPSSKTALAEAELEYNKKHKSKAIYVKFRMNSIPDQIKSSVNNELYALVWTTTPWTLLSNQGICFNPKLSYSIVQQDNSSVNYIIASNLIKDVAQLLNCSLTILTTFPGSILKNATYHNILDEVTILPFLSGSHPSDTKGTGLVHTAPAHGLDDYNVSLAHNMSIINMVDELGCFTVEAGSKFEGLFVLSDGNDAVLQTIADKIVYQEDFTHSYPYDWRTKKPVILRCSKQWFIDTDCLKTEAIEALKYVNVYPKSRSEIYKNNLIDQLKKRPTWCISRQRVWGVPIPVFYETKTNKALIEKPLINHLQILIDKFGPDYWWTLPLKDLLPQKIMDTFRISIDEVERGNDIFDIWYDSGLSWLSALENDRVADLYLEGADQFTGWFQSSLITSVALRNKSPYKNVYVHGFAVDKDGQKMSKSLGNVVDPEDIVYGKKGTKGYGIDALRWWVVCHANSDVTASVSNTVLSASAEEVQKIRSTLRFALGALHDYKQQQIDYDQLLIIDKYLLHLLHTLDSDISEMYNNYEFNHRLSSQVVKFLTNPVSSLYYITIKDRLYCNDANDTTRQACQFVLSNIFKVVQRCIAPILPHLTEELFMHYPLKTEESYFETCDRLNTSMWLNNKVAHIVDNIFINIQRDIHKIVGTKTTNLDVQIRLSKNMMTKLKEVQGNLQKLNGELTDILQVSQVTVVEDNTVENGNYNIAFKESDRFMCGRCRRVFSKVENELCLRCEHILQNKINISSLS